MGLNRAEHRDPTRRKPNRLLGDRPSFGDLVVVASLIFLVKAYGEDSEEWKRVRGLNGGRWAQLYDATAHLRQSEI